MKTLDGYIDAILDAETNIRHTTLAMSKLRKDLYILETQLVGAKENMRQLKEEYNTAKKYIRKEV